MFFWFNEMCEWDCDRILELDVYLRDLSGIFVGFKPPKIGLNGILLGLWP